MEWSGRDPAFENAVHRASAPPHLRAVLERVPSGLELRVDKPAGAADCPLSVLQLAKLALTAQGMTLGRAREADAWGIEIRRGERSVRLEADALAAGSLASLVEQALHGVLEPVERFFVLESFAREEVLLDSLHVITRHMLQATDVDEALTILLGGITSGYGLGFHRAALFLWDEQAGAFKGEMAIGPHDEAEAHRIWEAIETEDKTIECLIEDVQRGRYDTRLQERVRALSIVPAEGARELDALSAAGGVAFFDDHEPTLPALSALGVSRRFAMAEVRAHGTVLGLVFADNAFGDTTIQPHQRQTFGLFVSHTALVWENLKLLAHVEDQARRDALTGLLNRRAFDAAFRELAASATTSGATLGLLLLDIDEFKERNDSRGHEEGDRILRVLGALLGETEAHGAIASRWGGDEFAVLLEGATPETLRALAHRLGIDAHAVGIGLSMGAATLPDDVANPDALVSAADELLYQAKRAGRGRACFARGAPVVFA